MKIFCDKSKILLTLAFAILADGLIASALVHCFSQENSFNIGSSSLLTGCKVVWDSES